MGNISKEVLGFSQNIKLISLRSVFRGSEGA